MQAEEKVIALSDRRGARAAECHRLGEASFAERDALIAAEYQSLPVNPKRPKERVGFADWCETWGIPHPTAKEAVREAKTPGVRATNKRVQRAKAMDGRPSATPATPQARQGEINEAAMGFRAAMQRFAKATDPKKEREWATVGHQHLKFLISQSTLPALMGMTAEEIIAHIRGEKR